MRTLLLLSLILSSVVFASVDITLTDNPRYKINKQVEESILLVDLKIKAALGGGSGTVKVIRNKKTKKITWVEIKGRATTIGPFYEKIAYSDFKKGHPLNFILPGYTEPRMIIEAHVSTLDDYKGGKAKINYLTSRGYKSKEVSIWPDDRNELHLWDESLTPAKMARTLVIKVNPLNMKVIELLYE